VLGFIPDCIMLGSTKSGSGAGFEVADNEDPKSIRRMARREHKESASIGSLRPAASGRRGRAQNNGLDPEFWAP
jgi:hypothetical protein